MKSLVAAIAAILSTSALADVPVQDTVTVTATRSAHTVDESLASVTVIDRAEIERSQAPDLLELLRVQAGVDVARTGGPGQSTSVFLRGTNSNHVLVLIDGVRVASVNSGAYDFANVPLEQIERVEIVRGPRASYWGSDAIGGVIQIFTRKPDGPGMRVRAGRYGTYAGTASYGVRSEDAGFGATLYGERSDGFSAQNANGFSFDPDDDGFINRNLSLNGDLALGTQRLSGTALATRADAEFDQGRSYSRSHSLSASLAGPLATNWSHVVSVTSARDDLTTPAFFSLFHTRRESLDWLHEIKLGERAQLNVGVNALHEAGETRDTFSGTPQYRETRDNRALFASYLRHDGSFDLELSARHDDNSAFGGETTAQAAGGWQWSDAGRAFVSFGQGFRAPNLNELYSPGFGGLFAGNPDLDPERSHSGELGVDFQAAAAHKFGARLYRTRISDLIAFDGGETFQAINIARARINGAELTYGWRGTPWRLDANATVQDTEDESTGQDLLRRPDRKLVVAVGREFGADLELGVEGQYASDRRDFSADLPSYALLAVRVNWTFAPGWRLGARLDNAFDRNYELASGYNTAGRAISVTLSYDGAQ